MHVFRSVAGRIPTHTVHAGVARNIEEARMARYRETPKGLVGFAGIYSAGGTDACCTGGAIVYVTPSQLGQVKAIKDSILARRNEVEVPVDMPANDAPGPVAVQEPEPGPDAIAPAAPPWMPPAPEPGPVAVGGSAVGGSAEAPAAPGPLPGPPA